MTASHNSFLLKSRVRFVFVCKVYGSWLFPWMYFLIPGVLYVLDGFFSCYEKKLCTMYTDVQYYRGPSYVLLGTYSSVQNTVGVQRFRKYSSINLHDVVGKDERSIRNFFDSKKRRNPESRNELIYLSVTLCLSFDRSVWSTN